MIAWPAAPLRRQNTSCQLWRTWGGADARRPSAHPVGMGTVKTATAREYARLGRLLAERRTAAVDADCAPPTWTEHAAALYTSVRSLQRADRWCREHGAAREAAPAMADYWRATLAALDRRADALNGLLDRLATAKHPGAAHELVACCKALAAIDAATREAVVYLPKPDEPTAKVARRKAGHQRDNARFRARLRAADPANVADAIREAASRLYGQATERDVETEAEACDLADELEEAPGMVEWPETLAVLREVAPDAVEALVTAWAAVEAAWDRAPEPEPIDLEALKREAAVNGSERRQRRGALTRARGPHPAPPLVGGPPA